MAKAKDEHYYKFVRELNAELADAIALLNKDGPIIRRGKRARPA